MTAQTQAQRNASYRVRQREKIARYEGALREIGEHPGPFADEACWHRVACAKEALGL